MTLRKALWLSGSGFAVLSALYAASTSAPLPFRVYRSLEPFDDVDLPLDYRQPSEWVQARLMYPPHPNGRFSKPLNFGGWRDWREGGTSWSQDYPRADRHFAAALRRLTRIQARSVEQPVNPDDGEDIFNWPWLVAGEMGDWLLTESQARKLREYLLRGGFLMVDDMWGPGNVQWDVFRETMRRVLPEAQVTETLEGDPSMHVLYDIQEKDRSFIPGTRHLRRGPGGGVIVQQPPGTAPAWRQIADSHDRMSVAVNFNTDIGDAWEYADAPEYPEHMTALAYRYGINYLIYSMTH
jgi:hypothetical protein